MIKLILMIALLFISGTSMAQKVVTVDGKAIIDNRDMPTKTITTAKKARITNATNVASGTNDLNDLSSKESNKTVSHYFEVMKTDYNNGKHMDWLAAFQGCVDYDSGDGKKEWRLPTQRELMLIWTLHVPLKNKVVDFVSFLTDDYWSATSPMWTKNSWTVYFRDGAVSSYDKAATGLTVFRVRCIRDLTPPAK